MMARAPRVVAELGRPETAQETADRKAEFSRTYRASQNTRNLIAALLVTLAVVVVIVFAVPRGSLPEREPTARPFTIMPASGHLVRIIDIYPPRLGGTRTVMHRTRTLDYAMVIEGEIVLVLSDSEVVLGPGEVVVQRGTDHAWENRTDNVTRMAFFHIAGEFCEELLARLPQPIELMK